jgi:hypothetical protein
MFQIEITKQCRYALQSIQLLVKGIAIYESKERDEWYPDVIWYPIQNFLIAAANVSKFLWGSTKGKTRDRQILRQSLGVPDNSILKLSPGFRNHFEHLDERIEVWAEETKGRPNLEEYVSNITRLVTGSVGDVLRTFDPKRQTVSFRGETFAMVPVIEALTELMEVADAASERPQPDSWADLVEIKDGNGQ